MAITGYEVDQVTHDLTPEEKARSSTTADNLGGFSCYPNCSSSDKSVPIYNAYNHHYFDESPGPQCFSCWYVGANLSRLCARVSARWLVGNDSEVFDLPEVRRLPNPTRTGVRSLPNDHGFPTNIVFKENPGGEFRKSYHGYPSGYAQLLHSPTQWLVEPMQVRIDPSSHARSPLTDALCTD